ncbi:MAG: 50S ribosomal protein L25 [Thermodesulfobacteriota bacterium]|nr:50S ribosomal protein L25 [Thermodesulfobacteriota bacterium]
MKQIVLDARSRNDYGKSANRKLRNAGLIPAVLYGRKKEPVGLSLYSSQLKKILDEGAREGTLVELTITTDKGSQKRKVILKELKVHPVNSSYLHVDLYEVDVSEKIVVPVSIKIVGKAKGEEDGGVLTQVKREIEVKCLPSNIPEYIEVDVSDLEIGKSIHVENIILQEDIELIESLDTTLVNVSSPAVTKEELSVEEDEEGVAEGTDEKPRDEGKD